MIAGRRCRVRRIGVGAQGGGDPPQPVLRSSVHGEPAPGRPGKRLRPCRRALKHGRNALPSTAGCWKPPAATTPLIAMLSLSGCAAGGSDSGGPSLSMQWSPTPPPNRSRPRGGRGSAGEGDAGPHLSDYAGAAGPGLGQPRWPGPGGVPWGLGRLDRKPWPGSGFWVQAWDWLQDLVARRGLICRARDGRSCAPARACPSPSRQCGRHFFDASQDPATNAIQRSAPVEMSKLAVSSLVFPAHPQGRARIPSSSPSPAWCRTSSVSREAHHEVGIGHHLIDVRPRALFRIVDPVECVSTWCRSHGRPDQSAPDQDVGLGLKHRPIIIKRRQTEQAATLRVTELDLPAPALPDGLCIPRTGHSSNSNAAPC